VGEVVREGVSIWYEERGEGEPLVLIGGIGHPVCMWGESLGLLSRSFRVVAFDNRGTGKSDKPQTGYSMDAFVDDTLAVIQAVGLNRPHVLGFSLGGFIAQALACRAGDKVDKLVLVNTAFGGPEGSATAGHGRHPTRLAPTGQATRARARGRCSAV